MHQPPKPRTQKLTILAQDPGVRTGTGKQAKILRAELPIPAEDLAPGPWGYRVQVVDYDASTDTLWKPVQYDRQQDVVVDPFQQATDEELLANPQFHQQNVYAIVMRILARFEHALGRRVSWSFGGHQLKVAPHAFADANAFYSREDEALLFGYFADPKHAGKGRTPTPGKGIVFTCLSHDVVAHETTHALVDGLRTRFTDPSSPDQAAFHEGISDVVALLSVFALPEVMRALLRNEQSFTADSLRQTALFQLAEEMGSIVSRVRGGALRHSVNLEVTGAWKSQAEFLEPHRRGEVLVAAMLNALIEIWARRAADLRQDKGGRLDLDRVVEEGQRAADYLLTMSIRALDYCPPVHLEFGDYLSAMLTADREIRPDDSPLYFRRHLLDSFQAFALTPTSPGAAGEPGIWQPPEHETAQAISYDRIHFEPMQSDPDEVFRFIWENRVALFLREDAYTEVLSVRPCVRSGEDGFVLRETVAEYVQILRLMPEDLEQLQVELPPPTLFPRDQEVFLHGGGTLIFDEYGRLKYHIHNRLQDEQGRLTVRQIERLKFLAGRGYFLNRARTAAPASRQRQFGQMHLNRALNRSLDPTEGWQGGEVDLPANAAAHSHAHQHAPHGDDDHGEE